MRVALWLCSAPSAGPCLSLSELRHSQHQTTRRTVHCCTWRDCTLCLSDREVVSES